MDGGNRFSYLTSMDNGTQDNVNNDNESVAESKEFYIDYFHVINSFFSSFDMVI